MEEENQVESQDTTEGAEASDQSQAIQQNDKPAGYHPVDLSELPPEVQEKVGSRIDYLYRQVRENGRHLNDYRSIAQQQAQQIEDLMNGVGKVVDHLQTKDTETQEANLRYQLRQAIQDGDYDRQEAINDQLLELKIAKVAPKQKPEPKQAQQVIPNSFSGVAMGELAEGSITEDDISYVEQWQAEKDDTGRLLRPWAFSKNPNNPMADPEYVRGLRETYSVFDNPKFANLSVDQKFAEVDRRMGVVKPRAGQTVMGANLTTRSKLSKVSLSPQQERIAVKTKFGGSSAKSDADHIAAYRKQLETIQASKGSR